MKRSAISDAGLQVTESSPGVYVLTPKLQPPEDDGRLYAWRGDGWEPIPDNAVGEPPNDGKAYMRQSGAWLPAPVVKVAEAPEDGEQYVRGSGRWERVAVAGISDSPADGKTHARKDGAWVALAAPSTVTEPPADGQFYARANGAWKPLTTTGKTVKAQTVAGAGDILQSDCDVLQLETGSALVLFTPGTPSVVRGTSAGQELIVTMKPGSSGSVELIGTPATGLSLGDRSRVIRHRGLLRLVWSGDTWIESGFTNPV